MANSWGLSRWKSGLRRGACVDAASLSKADGAVRVSNGVGVGAKG